MLCWLESRCVHACNSNSTVPWWHGPYSRWEALASPTTLETTGLCWQRPWEGAAHVHGRSNPRPHPHPHPHPHPLESLLAASSGVGPPRSTSINVGGEPFGAGHWAHDAHTARRLVGRRRASRCCSLAPTVRFLAQHEYFTRRRRVPNTHTRRRYFLTPTTPL